MIWLTGARGLLGTEMRLALAASGLSWTSSGREVDVSDPAAVSEFCRGKPIDWVVNCAAYTAVDRAESEPEECARVNAAAPSVLAQWCGTNGAALVHLSTDYVFSGSADHPYREDDDVSSQGVYGRTKAEGEDAVRQWCPRHYIVRTSWLYGAHGPNFVYTMLRLMARQPQLSVVADQRGNPTWTADLSAALMVMLGRQGPWGTYHASGEGVCSWHEFAQAIQDEAISRKLLTERRSLAAIPAAEYPTPARRPVWSALSKDKLRAEFGFAFPSWRDSLRAFLGTALERRYLV